MRNQQYLPGFLALLAEVDHLLHRSALDPLHRRLLQHSLDILRQDFFEDKLIPALLFPILAREALGVSPAPVFNQLGAAHFLFYGFLDITDDVEDRDLKGLLWQDLGEPAAINIGSSLLFLSQQMLHEMDIPAPLKLALLASFSEAGYLLTVGQHRDLLSARNPAQGVQGSLNTHLLKTGSSIALYLVTSAQLAGASSRMIEAFESLGHDVGVLMQIFGDWRDTEKKDSPDFANGCESVPLQLLRAHVDDADRAYLERLLLEAKNHTPLPFELYRYLLRKYQIRGVVNQWISHYHKQAVSHLQTLEGLGCEVESFYDFLARFKPL